MYTYCLHGSLWRVQRKEVGVLLWETIGMVKSLVREPASCEGPRNVVILGGKRGHHEKSPCVVAEDTSILRWIRIQAKPAENVNASKYKHYTWKNCSGVKVRHSKLDLATQNPAWVMNGDSLTVEHTFRESFTKTFFSIRGFCFNSHLACWWEKIRFPSKACVSFPNILTTFLTTSRLLFHLCFLLRLFFLFFSLTLYPSVSVSLFPLLWAVSSSFFFPPNTFFFFFSFPSHPLPFFQAVKPAILISPLAHLLSLSLSLCL